MTAKTLAMMKMEKNFIAVIEKKYPRKPYEEYSIIDCIGFVKREHRELRIAIEALERLKVAKRLKIESDENMPDLIISAMWEVADVSNTLDYLFEGLLMLLKTWEGDL